MRTRPLGQSGIDASVVGLGTWAIGGWMWGGSDKAEAIAGIHAALDQGVNLLDTAPIYGFGLSEEIVGEAIADRRDRVLVATKCSMVCDANVGDFKFRSTAYGPSPNGHITINIFNGPASIRAELESSLARMGIDHIDLYQTHWQESTTPFAETMGELMRLKEEGKIRAIGVCNATGEQMSGYRSAGPLDTDQEQYSLVHRVIEADQLPYCREAGIAMLAYSPLALGLLTGKITADMEFPPGDLRRDHPRFQVETRRRIVEMLEQIKPLASDRGVTLAQLITAWTLHQPGLTHVLCGARRPEHAIENAAAADLVLAAEELAAITGAAEPVVTA